MLESLRTVLTSMEVFEVGALAKIKSPMLPFKKNGSISDLI